MPFGPGSSDRGDRGTGKAARGASFTAWTPEGTFVATGSQTASMVHLFEADELDRWRARLR